MLVTRSGPRLPSALCIQHGAVAPRGREGARQEKGEREGVSRREKEPNIERPKHATGIWQSTTCRTHVLYARYTHPPNEKSPPWYKELNLNLSCVSMCVCVWERERQRQVGQFVWQAAKRFSYPLHNLPPIPRRTHTHSSEGEGLYSYSRQKARLLLPPLRLSFSAHLPTYYPLYSSF